MSTPPDALLMWSGGMDSTAVLYLAVRTGHRIRAHHVILRDLDHRADAELASVHAQLEWFSEHGYSDQIEYSESSVDLGDDELGWGVPNVHMIAPFAGLICASQRGRNITRILHPYHRDCDYREIEIYRQAYKYQCRTMAWRVPDMETPLASLNKAGVAAQLPADLRALTWSCRTPDNGRRCGRCGTCQCLDN